MIRVPVDPRLIRRARSLFHCLDHSVWIGSRSNGSGFCRGPRNKSSRRRTPRNAVCRCANCQQAFALSVPHEEAMRIRDDVAFHEPLETKDSAVRVLGDDTLRDIARELVETVRNNVRIDWTIRENVRATMRRLVKRILRKHGYPPDKQEKATRTVLEKAEVLSEGWAA